MDEALCANMPNFRKRVLKKLTTEITYRAALKREMAKNKTLKDQLKDREKQIKELRKKLGKVSEMSVQNANDTSVLRGENRKLQNELYWYHAKYGART